MPDAMYYNVYYQTSQGVSIKPNELTRPDASQDDFNPVIGSPRKKGIVSKAHRVPTRITTLPTGCVTTTSSPSDRRWRKSLIERSHDDPVAVLASAAVRQEGVDDGEFRSPTGIALDSDGHIYVADTDNHAIQRFDKDGNCLARWGGEADSEDGTFYYPRGLATAPEGHVYVADSGNNRVQKFDPDGNFLNAWGKFGFAWRGAEAGKFDVPWGVATDQQGILRVGYE